VFGRGAQSCRQSADQFSHRALFVAAAAAGSGQGHVQSEMDFGLYRYDPWVHSPFTDAF